MDIITTIECIAVLIGGAYLLGLGTVWICEIKRSALYRDMQKSIKLLETFRLSMAVLHAKKYKVLEDYRRDTLGIEKVRKFILGKLLMDRHGRQNISLNNRVMG